MTPVSPLFLHPLQGSKDCSPSSPGTVPRFRGGLLHARYWCLLRQLQRKPQGCFGYGSIRADNLPTAYERWRIWLFVSIGETSSSAWSPATRAHKGQWQFWVNEALYFCVAVEQILLVVDAPKPCWWEHAGSHLQVHSELLLLSKLITPHIFQRFTDWTAEVVSALLLYLYLKQ